MSVHVDLTTRIRRHALELGFSRAGFCRAQAPPGLARFREWLAAGYDGEMRYLRNREPAYSHPESVLKGVVSLVMLTLPYKTALPAKPATGTGRISRYAWGPADYHDVVHRKLDQLRDQILQIAPGAQVRGVVDTAPLLEREFAQLAGLGWVGKNTMLIHPQDGSFLFLAALLTDLNLVEDPPFDSDHCGSCRACLDACPTQAFPRPYQLDARRCISYLNIELRTPIPEPLRAAMGDWIFGCDICQDVCPWNHKPVAVNSPEFLPREGGNPLPLADLFSLDDEAFRNRFRATPLWRAKRRGILRNAAIVLGNQRACDAKDELGLGLNDHELLVREAAAWALGQLPTSDARDLLKARHKVELDPLVRNRIEIGLET
jgi:epoxyqueuosine reductase